MLLQLYASNYTVYSCMRELPFYLDINENSILPLQFYTSDDGKIFQRLASGSVFFLSCFSSTATYPAQCVVGHFHIMIRSLALKLSFMMNQHGGQRKHSWKPSLHRDGYKPPKNIPLNQIKCNPNLTSY